MAALDKTVGSSAELSKRRTTWQFIRTLLWKNSTLKRRRRRATILEIVLPSLFITLLSGLKHTVDNVSVPAGWSDERSATSDATVGTSYNLYQSTGGSLPWISGDLPKFAQYETSVTGLLFYMALMSAQNGLDLGELSVKDQKTCLTGVATFGMVDTNTSSPHTVPPACGGRIAPYKLAIVPDTTFTREYFLQTMAEWYPRVNLLNSSTSPQVPSLVESVTFFESEEALEEYVKGNDYGSGLANPRIYGGIVFDTYPADGDIGTFQSIEYTLRLNSTHGDNGEVGRIPPTNGDPAQLYPLQKSIETDYYMRYALTGFMTLQTLVTRFVSCMPEWDATSKTTTGECQQAQTTAVSSEELDERLLSSLDNDAMIATTLATLGKYANSSANSSFAALRSMLSNNSKEALLKPLRQAPQPYLGSSVAPFPVEAYIDAAFYDDVSGEFSVIIILGYMYPMSRVLVGLIQEKELRLRELIKILGANDLAISVAWYITYFVIFFAGSVLQALAGLIGLFTSSSVTLVFLFFLLFGLSVLSYAFMMSTIFSDSRLGALVGMVVFLLMHFIASAFSTESAASHKTWACLLSPVSLSFGLQTLSTAESTGTGLHFYNAGVESENFRFTTSLWMFAFDSVLYTLLGLYLDKIVPKQYGTSLKWYFPFSPSYWRSRRSNDNQVLKTDNALLDNVVLDVNPNFEPVNTELREQEHFGDVLSVQRLRKVFSVPGGEKVAVQGLNLTMYKNQITCLLGHNGAGKTTLISMLTGMTTPTSGNATFNGLSITEDMDEIRQSLGICFQHDVLFPDLTVEEHLLFFGRIKGYTDEELKVVVDTQIREVGLTEKRTVKSSELSGGMKRKLSVAISLLGDSSLVFLDEPTSGMDPYSRRSTWEILLNNRNDRVMVLTTHFMDEADILGDRIAIMAEGEVRCCGSSLFLKNRFGAGYNLTLVKDDAKCIDADVIAFVTSHVPSAQVLSNVGSEIAFQLPIDSSSQFAPMFTKMDANLKNMGLLSYGVSVTTLEEVFIKVAEMDDEGNQHTLTKHAAPAFVSPVPSPTSASDAGTGDVMSHSAVTQLRALVLKRLRYARRDRRSVLFSVIYPIILLFTGFMILKNGSETSDDPALVLSADVYDGDASPAPFYCQPTAKNDVWCSSLTRGSSYYSGATLQEVTIDQTAFDSDSPTVFDVTYSDPTINATDATGYGLRLGQMAYNRGYGINTGSASDQYGAYLVYGESERNVLGYNLFVNSTATHSPVIFKALMDQAVYRFFASNASDGGSSSVGLKVKNHPLPLTSSSKTLFSNTLAFSACVFICIAFTYFTASIVVFLVKERQSEHNSKHQQLVSGVSLYAFWLSNYVYDLLVYLVPFVAALILIKAFDISTMTGSSGCYSCTSETFPAVVVLFILFGLAICPFTYCLSYLFKEHASSQTYTVMINLVIGTVLMIVSFILDAIDSTKDVNAVLVFFWRLSPLFDLGNGLVSLVLHEARSVRSSTTTKTSPFSTDLMGFEMIYLVVLTVLYGAIAIGVDYSLTFKRVKSVAAGQEGHSTQDELDVDVKKEADRVASGGADNDVVKLMNLRKVYNGGKVAVQDLSFGLKRGECLGFLGINGAGKTTTMKMLTGDVAPTQGGALLGGYDILTQQIEVRRQIGYCPQFDALFDKLTVREHLELFASIKGVSGAELNSVVKEKIDQLNLADFENKLAGSLSGGNKRKLSVAIAMIGNPRIIFLDEPSTGMDPVSRRFMWDVIAGISTRGKASTIVLTTHSMEEAEALCSRVGIMVGGRLRCLGSTQHLKSRFGDGLVFDVKLAPPSHEELECLIQEVFGDSAGTVAPSDLRSKCLAFGNELLADRVVASHPTGYSLAAAMQRDGFVRAEAFCSWCIEETRFDALHAFLEQEFGAFGVQVMERQNDFCRFKLRGSNESLKLSKVFAIVEGMKTSMYIREYSVSQTTLEQIFNSFASQQQEEQGTARGVLN